MRRTITVAVVAGLAIGGLLFGELAAGPAFASGHAAKPVLNDKPPVSARPSPHARTTPGPPAGIPARTKIVAYDGYELHVPATWPVYRLAQDPTRCVRYDVHAVYLGVPGPNQECPAHLVGRTQTISIIPGDGITYQRAQLSATGSTPVASLPSVRGAIVQNAQQHEFRVALGAASESATVVATYSDNAALAEHVLTSLRDSPAASRATPDPSQRPVSPPFQQRAAVRARPRPPARPATASTATASTATANTKTTSPSKTRRPSPKPHPAGSSAWRGLPSSWPTEVATTPPAPTPTPKPTPTSTPTSTPTPTPTRTPTPTPTPTPPKPARPGFDTCTAPSVAAMRAWRSAYSVIGVYIGGVNAACDYGNLSARWIRQTKALGWSTLPTYVGPQAPCYGYAGVTINAHDARTQGRQAADDAVRDAKLLGLAKGSPVYYDMEAYNENKASCVSAVLTFLGAWTAELGKRGYVSGVYSSQDSGITNMNSAARAKRPSFRAPQAIWVALWDNSKSLKDGRLAWPVTDRVKQYSGPHERKIGGVTLDIDSDNVGGPTAG